MIASPTTRLLVTLYELKADGVDTVNVYLSTLPPIGAYLALPDKSYVVRGYRYRLGPTPEAWGEAARFEESSVTVMVELV